MTEGPPTAGWWDDSEEHRHGRHPRHDAAALRDAAKKPGFWLLVFCHRHDRPSLAAVVLRRGGEPVFVTTAQGVGVPLQRAAAVNVTCPRCARAETVRSARVLEAADRLRTLSAKARRVDVDTLLAPDG